MRFFRNQDRARRNSVLLLALFIIALMLIVLAVCGAIYLTRAFISVNMPPFFEWLRSGYGLGVVGVTVLLILGGTVHRFVYLAGGGERVALMARGRPIVADTENPFERRLRNVTEEMAIASGVTMPRLYVMDLEYTINAFVAGHRPNEVVLVVTRGALEELNREELQGVIGHEFSHILNGDMRINVRLIALLAGILMIGQTGRLMLRTRYAVLALVPTTVGYVGVLLGRLIQSAISRQREYLADAAAVQFTRNPQGLAGALYKITLHRQGAQLIRTSQAECLNHMCFGASVHFAFQKLMASHPPIEDRIQALDDILLPSLEARYDHSDSGRGAQESDAVERVQTTSVAGATGLAGAATVFSVGASVGNRLSECAGEINLASEDYAARLLERLPESFYEQLHTTAGAVHLCYVLLLQGKTKGLVQRGVGLLSTVADVEPDGHLIRNWIDLLDELGPGVRLPALEISLPALRELPEESRSAFLEQLQSLAELNVRISLSEYAVLGFLRSHLRKNAGKPVRARFRRYAPVLKDIRILLWLMCGAAADSEECREALYTEVLSRFEVPPQPPGIQRITTPVFVGALQRLNGLFPKLKPAILDACADCVLDNGRMSSREYELMRIIADQLDAPMPPMPFTQADWTGTPKSGGGTSISPHGDS